MRRHISPEQAMAALRTRSELEQRGWRSRDIERALESGRIRRLQPNRYVKGSLWEELWPESRHLLEVAAAHAEKRDGGAAASYMSAGVVFGIPLYRHVPQEIHMTLPTQARSSSRPGLMRHREPLPDEDVTIHHGIVCTTLERTTFDATRVLTPEAAVAFADAALRQVAMSGSTYDFEAAEVWRDKMLERVDRARGVRGVRQAREVIAFADGRAELPGESVSRFRLRQLGFTRIGLQVVVAGPAGGEFRVDLEIEEAETFFEFDGERKYRDEALRTGRSLEDVLLEEKQREDWIRGTTQKRMVRASDPHVATPAALEARLAKFGIRPPGR